MKFPYDLSEQRLSLLSKEDRELYLYEHSPYYSYTAKEEAFKSLVESRQIRQQYYLNELKKDANLNDLNDSEMLELSNAFVDDELNEYKEMLLDTFEDIYKDAYGKDARNIIEKTIDSVFEKSKTLNEAPGPDLTWWMKGLEGGFLGLLGLGIGAMAGLFMAGKDKAAQKALERSMNKAVEMIDTGIYKKKSFFGSLLGKIGLGKLVHNEVRGDQSNACFRTIQEMYERNWLKNLFVSAKAAGFLGDNNIQDAITQQFTGGLYSKTAGTFAKEVDAKFSTYFKSK